jgi:hypothetical protein
MYPTIHIHEFKSMNARDVMKTYVDGDLSLFDVKRNLGCFGSNPGVVPAIATLHATTKTLSAEFLDLASMQQIVSPSPMSVCTCIDQLYYASFFKVKNDLSVGEFSADLIEYLKALKPFAGLLPDWLFTENNYEGNGFANINISSSVGAYCPSREQRHSDVDLKQKCKDTPACLSACPSNDEICVLQYPFGTEAEKMKCRKDRNAEIIHTCVRGSVPTMEMKQLRGGDLTRYIFYGQNFLVMYVLLSLIRCTFDAWSRSMWEDGDSVPETRRNKTLLMVMSLMYFAIWVVQWLAPLIIVSREKKLEKNLYMGDEDPVMILMLMVNFILIAPFGMFVYAHTDTNLEIESPYQKLVKHKNNSATPGTLGSDTGVKANGIEVTWKLFVLIMSQIVIDVPLITGFTFLGAGLLMQTGVQDYASISTVKGILVVVGFISHISHVLKQIQFRFGNFVDCSDSDSGGKTDEYDAMDVTYENLLSNVAKRADILHAFTKCRILASLVVVIGGYILYMCSKEDAARPSAVSTYAGNEYLIMCIMFIVINVGFDVWYEIKYAYYESNEDSKGFESNEGTQSRAWFVIIFLLISNLMVMGQYYQYDLDLDKI